ncbi:hypothetical protein GO001_34125 [Streptomyces sp. NRRL B-1677]|uniref:TcpD family membrane protein n=1 Tax=Streptomyces sp. NRRL B-1677 TaxID=2682966 RepID=UPI001892AE8F|nr:TcpD family membrane protein [Streptomyces sp. NRRL B-1677]MBF6050153.1 hypothetical protein [Streptomyces sp. NRRL B-1677]
MEFVTLAAPLVTGDGLKKWVLVVAGNLFIAVLAARLVGCFMKKDWGEMITMFAAAVLVVGFVYFPDQTVELLKTIWQTVVGS